MITFQNLTPGWVVAGVPKSMRPWKVLSPEEYAQSAIRTVGLVENTRGHWAHQLDFDVTLCLPTPIVNYLLSNMLTARKRQLKLDSVPGTAAGAGTRSNSTASGGSMRTARSELNNNSSSGSGQESVVDTARSPHSVSTSHEPSPGMQSSH